MGIVGVLGAVTVSMFGSFTTGPVAPMAPATTVASIGSFDCSLTEAPAKVKAMAVVLPEIVRQGSVIGTGAIGQTQLQVDLARNGHPSSIQVTESSGNKYLDHAAYDGALLGAYSAEVKNCERVAGSYILYVDFVV